MKILKISRKNFIEVVKTTTDLVKKGGIVVCPTDTIYGLIADATNEEAIERVFKIKKRKEQKPIPVFVKDIKMAKDLAQIDKKQQEFLAKIWPGKVAAVLKQRKDCDFPKILFGNKKTIGLRISRHELVKVLLEKINRPLTGTSANISGKPGSTEIKRILTQFKNQKFQPDLVIDAGNLKSSEPSTIVSLTKSRPELLRVGGLSKKELSKILK